VLTGQLLAFSRQQVVPTRIIDLNAEMLSIEPTLRQLIGPTGELLLKLEPAAGHIRVDAGQIGQVVVNLVVNARDAMPAGGMITIRTANVAIDRSPVSDPAGLPPGAYVVLSVTDVGVGMDSETRERIFEPFFTTKDVGKGTGLGLATAHGIVRQAGGEIRVRSELGQGSVFDLFFPRVDEPADDAPHDVERAHGGAGRVLVVDNDPAVRTIITRFLERAGYVVVAMADGEAALAAAAASPPFDVLVTAVVMPAMSGTDLTARMVETNPDIAVVLLSGYARDDADMDRLGAYGGTFVSKPVTSNRMLEAVIEARARRSHSSSTPSRAS
jgi:CheY-like chemotaxis protein